MDSVPPELQAAFERERKATRALSVRDAPVARRETLRMYARMEALQHGVIARRGIAIACQRGCSYCCHLRVEIRPHDAFVLAQHLRTRFDDARRARVLARIEDNLARIEPLSL